jgi:hypothetical protein
MFVKENNYIALRQRERILYQRFIVVRAEKLAAKQNRLDFKRAESRLLAEERAALRAKEPRKSLLERRTLALASRLKPFRCRPFACRSVEEIREVFDSLVREEAFLRVAPRHLMEEIEFSRRHVQAIIGDYFDLIVKPKTNVAYHSLDHFRYTLTCNVRELSTDWTSYEAECMEFEDKFFYP